MITDNAGPVQIEVPFGPGRQFRAGDRQEAPTAPLGPGPGGPVPVGQGSDTGEISAHLEEVYGAEVSKDTITRITYRVVEEMQTWWARPLEQVYAAIFIDAIMVKVRDGQVRNRPVYAAIGVDLAGHQDVLGMWAGDGDGESAKFWYAVLTDLKSRRVCTIGGGHTASAPPGILHPLFVMFVGENERAEELIRLIGGYLYQSRRLRVADEALPEGPDAPERP